MNAKTSIFDLQTGRFLGDANTRGPLAIRNQQVFFQNDWFLIDYPDHVYIDVHDLRTGERLEDRTYSVENRVTGSYWSSKVAVAGAISISRAAATSPVFLCRHQAARPSRTSSGFQRGM